MSEHVTDADRKTALRVIRELAFVPLGHDMSPAAGVVAAALAAEREKARAPFLALADELDEVARQHDDAEPVKMDDLLRMITAARVTRHAADRIRHAAEEGQQ